jgi:hypothetical protein
MTTRSTVERGVPILMCTGETNGPKRTTTVFVGDRAWRASLKLPRDGSRVQREKRCTTRESRLPPVTIRDVKSRGDYV